MSNTWLFVSDWHMGAGKKSDDFMPAHDSACRFLSHYADLAYLGFVGDTFELGQANIFDIAKYHRDVVSLIAGLREQAVVLPGNHDFPIGRLASLVPWRTWGLQEVLQVFGRRILVLHSHQFDKWNRGRAPIGRAITRIAGWIERRGWSDVDRDLSRLRHKVEPKRVAVEEYDARSVELARKCKCDAVIRGHDHMPHEAEVDAIPVLDCGTWRSRFDDGYPFVRLEPKKLTLEFWPR